jgi:hypothetical protein
MLIKRKADYRSERHPLVQEMCVKVPKGSGETARYSSPDGSMPDQIWNAGMKVMLLNDTSLSPHVGSLAVSAVLDHLISRAGGEITHRVYVTEQGELWRGAAADSIRTRGAITDFGRTLEGRRRDFERCIHSSRRIGRRLWGTFHDLKRELDQSPFEKRINHHHRERMWLGRYIMALCAG